VNGCLDGLQNEDQRRVLALLLFEEMSYEEIAASVGRPLNTVRTDIRRGRLALRNCLVLRLGLER
jgi:DNA-directed RNA polymerase specialized sigma24 family protein